jgi:hypothetical protein
MHGDYRSDTQREKQMDAGDLVRIKKTTILALILGFISGFLIGRHLHPSKQELKNEIKDLKCSVSMLESNLLDCWHDLPLGCIRHGSVDY